MRKKAELQEHHPGDSEVGVTLEILYIPGHMTCHFIEKSWTRKKTVVQIHLGV